MPSSYLIWNGRVWGKEGADAILVTDGRIEAVGDGRTFEGFTGERVDAGGGAILPGFIDAHTHLLQSGLAECGWTLDLAGLSRSETLEALDAAACARARGEWLLAEGWDESRWTPSAALSRAELDRVGGDACIVAVRVDGHVAVLSRAALRAARDAIGSRSHLVDAATGRVREEAVEAVLSLVRPDAETVGRALAAAASRCHALGVTTAHVMSGWLDPRVLEKRARGLRLRLVAHVPAERTGELAERGVATGAGDDWFRWGGVKLFADGSVGARNAAFRWPYRWGGRGRLNQRRGALRDALAAADEANLQTLTHAIGDRAIAHVLRAHREARTRPELRHRIEHFEFPAAREVRAVRSLGLSVCMQPNFVGNWSGAGGLYEASLGRGRDARSNPFRRVLDAGIPLGFGSDGMPLSPLYGIASAVSPPRLGQRLGLEEAVRAYTEGAAGLSGGLPTAGRLIPGEKADLVVLDRFLCAETAAVARVRLTFAGGELVYSASSA